MSARLVIVEPGLATTVQDRGRFGLQRFGIPPSGALDPEGLAIANALAGNAPDAAALEMRVLGPTLRAEGGPVRIAVAGATVQMMLRDAEPMALAAGGPPPVIPGWRSVTLSRGATLKVGALSEGATGYIAVAGGIAVPPTLGSAATLTRAALGGYQGRTLAAGDEIAVEGTPPTGLERHLPNPPKPPPGWPCLSVRVVLGPQADHFTDAALETFLSVRWRVSAKADRMGMRLEGPVLAHHPKPKGADITSDGIVTGAVQVPASGQPILLLVDRQTSGGYAKIAAAITADLPALGRLAPGGEIRFQAVSAAEGAALAQAAAGRLQRLIASIAPLPKAGLSLEALHAENLIQPPIDDL
ncbi:MAG: biotin-dependent carboxyltransferase family protein [Pseudomonadota bacterium]